MSDYNAGTVQVVLRALCSNTSYPQLFACLLELLFEQVTQEDSELLLADRVITVKVQMTEDMLDLLLGRYLSEYSVVQQVGLMATVIRSSFAIVGFASP